jgi:hypothetical protein
MALGIMLGWGLTAGASSAAGPPDYTCGFDQQGWYCDMENQCNPKYEYCCDVDCN